MSGACKHGHRQGPAVRRWHLRNCQTGPISHVIGPVAPYAGCNSPAHPAGIPRSQGLSVFTRKEQKVYLYLVSWNLRPNQELEEVRMRSSG
jgi:hypothetical protein